MIVYSGGDDVFLAGAWNEVIAVFMDLRKSLERFTQGTLTISGGIGVYPGFISDSCDGTGDTVFRGLLKGM